MIKYILIGIHLLLFINNTKAQLFDKIEIYPNTKTIKGKYFNGCANGYWSIENVDSLGRIFEKYNYHKKELLSKDKIIYDSLNNKLFEIQLYDINNPEKIDTCIYKYKYANKEIIYQVQKISENYAIVNELIKNVGDSVFVYREEEYNSQINTNYTFNTQKLLELKNGLLIRTEKSNLNDNSKEIKTFEYYENGRLKRQMIENFPKRNDNAIYIGGIYSDDMTFYYKLDNYNRVKKYYMVIKGKKYKKASYKYYKK